MKNVAETGENQIKEGVNQTKEDKETTKGTEVWIEDKKTTFTVYLVRISQGV